jgi:choline dehydrogenase-like flavoprotein
MDAHDVVVVGSGYGGTIPAARLAEAGMSVVILERGKRIAPRDLRQSDDPVYLQEILDIVVSSDNIAYRTGSLVGGASINMDGAHFRMPQQSFEVTDASGRLYWPEGYSREALDPYYERAEAMFGVRQFGWSEIPKVGGMFAKMCAAAGASCERARMNYRDCLHCGFCSQGCIYDKKNDLTRTYLPVAENAGAEVRDGCEVMRIEPSGTGYIVRYVQDGQAREVFGQRVVVGCGGIHTPALLLRSSAHLTNLSEHVGENFNTNGEHGYIGILPPDFDGVEGHACYKGMENAGMMTFHWFESHGFALHPGGGLAPLVFASSLQAADHPLVPRRSWGLAYKRFVETVYPHRVIAFSSTGLADGNRAVVLGRGGQADLEARDRESYDAYLDRLDDVLDEVSRQSGVTILPAMPRRLSGMTSAHLLSSCRMAESPEDGVVDPDGEVFGHENLWICDASAMPYALGVNPALTISAVAERTAERIIARG